MKEEHKIKQNPLQNIIRSRPGREGARGIIGPAESREEVLPPDVAHFRHGGGGITRCLTIRHAIGWSGGVGLADWLGGEAEGCEVDLAS
ncbi:unnamed protein product [Caretta caretta]